MSSQSPEEIRAEIERTRANLSNDVDALADQANPKNIAKRKVDDIKDKGIGLKDRIMGSASDAVETVTDKAHDVADKVTGHASNATGSASGSLQSAATTHAGQPASHRQRRTRSSAAPSHSQPASYACSA